MSKNKFLSFAVLCSFLVLGNTTLKAAETTSVPSASEADACQASRQNRETCKTWYTLNENPTPDACLSSRQNREACDRWYHVGVAAPKLQAKKVVIDQKIHFDFNKSDIKSESYGILDDVASVLKANSKIQKVRVEGHTDSIGSDEYNQKLSEQRANAVKGYLVGKGIEGGRLNVVGFGESRPLADNNSDAGRAQNRRTEFNVAE